MKLVVAVSGQPGSGKTTYAKFIASRYGLRYVSNGMLFREMAKERGVSLEEFHRLAEQDPSIDRLVDERAREEALKGGVVVDGHLAVWYLKDIAHVKIVFIAPLDVRVSRVSRRENRDPDSVLRELVLREKSNAERARKYYGIDIHDLSVADLVVNTGQLDVAGVKSVVASYLDGLKRVKPHLFE